MRRGLVLAALMLVGCEEEPPEGATILAIGDSYFDYNIDEGSTPAVVGEELGAVVWNKAIGGTRMLEGRDAIPDQYVSGEWDWVLISGGGNDMGGTCGCNGCDDLLDQILSEDGTSGVYIDLAKQIQADGARVLVSGYGQLLDEREGFEGCDDELAEMNARGQAMEANNEGVWYVTVSAVVDGTDPSMFDEDGVHPSPAGSQVIGRLLAEKIREVEGE